MQKEGSNRDKIRPEDRIETADGSYCGKNLYESQSQAGAKVYGAHAQSLSALWTFARILPKIPALPPLFPFSGVGGGNTRSNQIELVRMIDDLRLTTDDWRQASKISHRQLANRQS